MLASDIRRDRRSLRWTPVPGCDSRLPVLETLVHLDRRLFYLVNGELVHPWLDRFFSTITDFGAMQIPLAIFALAVLVFGTPRTRYMILLAAMAVLMADMLGQDLKLAIGRARPYAALENVRLPDGGGSSRNNSFPSNHAVNNFAAATILFWYFRRKLWAPFIFVVPVLVAYSRVYVGVHYPADVMAGAIFGTAMAAAFLAFDARMPAVKFTEKGRLVGVGWGGLTVLFLLCLNLYKISIISRGAISLGAYEVMEFAGEYRVLSPLTLGMAWLFGRNDLAVRLPSILAILAASVLLARLVFAIVENASGDQTKAERAAFAAVALLNLSPFVAMASARAVPAGVMLFFTVLCLWLAHRALAKPNATWYPAFGALLAGVIISPAAILLWPGIARASKSKLFPNSGGKSRALDRIEIPLAIIGLVGFAFLLFGSNDYEYRLANLAGYSGLACLLAMMAVCIVAKNDNNVYRTMALWAFAVGLPLALAMPDPLSWLVVPSALGAVVVAINLDRWKFELRRDNFRTIATPAAWFAIAIYTFVLIFDRSGWWTIYKHFSGDDPMPLWLDPSFANLDWNEIKNELRENDFEGPFDFEPVEMQALAEFYDPEGTSNTGREVTIDPSTAPSEWENMPIPLLPFGTLEIEDKDVIYRRLFVEEGPPSVPAP